MDLSGNRLLFLCVIVAFFMLLIVGSLSYGQLIGFLDDRKNNSPVNVPVDISRVNDTKCDNLTYRLVFIQDDIGSHESLENVQDIMRRAKNAGYNGIVFSSDDTERLDTASADYRNNLLALKKTADDMGLDLYPTVLTVGNANAILSHDPDQVEGLPVKDALFVTHNGLASLVPDPSVSLPGGSFDKAAGNRFSGWDAQDNPGAGTFADTGIKHTGASSLRIEAKGNIERVYKAVDVSPFRQYHLSLWVKTQDVTNPESVMPAITGKNGKELAFANLALGSTQGWKEYDIVFNSLNNSNVEISLGTWENSTGTIWIDDARLEEIGLTNVIRRDECPVIVKGEDGTVYNEGTDYYRISDPLLGNDLEKGSYAYHASPDIRLTPDSRIREGERLRVSFYYATTVYRGQVAVSLTSPKAQSLFHDQVVAVNEAIHPQGFFLNYDEIRVGNWEGRPTPMTEGQVLAASIGSTDRMVKAMRPDAAVFVWNDMFDPYQNAIDNYYLCNGTIDGSYGGVPGDMIIVDWNYVGTKSNSSLKFWAERGNPLVIAGYYDGSGRPIAQWLREANQAGAKVTGVMYTTWDYDYTGLEKFANDAWGHG